MKKILVLILILFSIVYIYTLTIDKKVYYLSLDNDKELFSNNISSYLSKKNKLEKYIYGFSNQNTRVSDYLNMIKENNEIKYNNKKITIKNALIKADLITISLNMDDLNYYMNSVENYIEYKNDLFEFLKKVREYSKEDIFLIGIYYNNKLNNVETRIKKLNYELIDFCNEYKIKYIDIIENRNNLTNKLIEEIENTVLNQ